MSREHSQCTTLTSLRQSSFRRVSSQVNSHPRHPRHQQHYHCPHHCHNHHCYCYDNSHPSPRQILSLILDSFMVTMIATLIIIDDDESWSRCQVKFGSSSPWEGKFCLDQKWEKLIIVNAEDNDNDHCWKSPIFRNVYFSESTAATFPHLHTADKFVHKCHGKHSPMIWCHDDMVMISIM